MLHENASTPVKVGNGVAQAYQRFTLTTGGARSWKDGGDTSWPNKGEGLLVRVRVCNRQAVVVAIRDIHLLDLAFKVDVARRAF